MNVVVAKFPIVWCVLHDFAYAAKRCMYWSYGNTATVCASKKFEYLQQRVTSAYTVRSQQCMLRVALRSENATAADAGWGRWLGGSVRDGRGEGEWCDACE